LYLLSLRKKDVPVIVVDFVTSFSPHSIAESNASLAELLEQLDAQNTTLALATSRRGLINQVNSEAIAETLDYTAPYPRLLPVGTLDPRRYLGWREDLRRCVEGGCVAIRFAPGRQRWSPNTLLFEKMVEAIGTSNLPIIVDFDGAGLEGSSWIHPIAAATHRHGVLVVLNEVGYSSTQELLDEIAGFGRPVKIHMDESGSPYPGLRRAAERNPNLVIIKAHGDDGLGARQVEDLPNVYFEFCSSEITPGRIRRATDVLGPERILFGTDQQLFAPWYQLGAYLDAIKDEDEIEMIFRQNPRRIFDLGID
jgi:predicted TIM-barrel fold metal-dependent hydrolase